MDEGEAPARDDGGDDADSPLDRLPPATAALLDAVLPFVQTEAIDELALRLSGLTGDALTRESSRLVGAILNEMGRDTTGHVEKLVVLATMRAAVTRARQTPIGRA